jgi:hypothetical protein
VLHTTLILLHATFAVVTFGVGCALLVSLPTSLRSGRFVAYYVSAWLAVIFLVIVVLVDWAALPVVKRIAFGALCLLALYLLWRTDRARSCLVHRTGNWRKPFIGHVGFVLISLFDGFCIVAAIDLRLPPVVIALVAVLGVAAGIVAIRYVVRREATREAGVSAVGAG